jgi:hypothetical protein
MEHSFPLREYVHGLKVVLVDKYGTDYSAGFAAIEARFQEVRSGARDLSVDDVLAIFGESLPFVLDWTKPDAIELERKMNDRAIPVAHLIRQLNTPDTDDNEIERIGAIVGCFRELGLTSLVLHHVYPARYAACSHHIASLLHITGETVPRFYVAYCKELRTWSKQKWSGRGALTVVDVEFALWTWYRLAFSDDRESGDHSEHTDRFFSDSWIQRRRASRIARSLNVIDKMDLARSFLPTDPTVTTIIAFRELEVGLRRTLGPKASASDNARALLEKLSLDAFPQSSLRIRLMTHWTAYRNKLIHQDVEITNEEATAVVNDVVAFFRHQMARGS